MAINNKYTIFNLNYPFTKIKELYQNKLYQYKNNIN